MPSLSGIGERAMESIAMTTPHCTQRNQYVVGNGRHELNLIGPGVHTSGQYRGCFDLPETPSFLRCPQLACAGIFFLAAPPASITATVAIFRHVHTTCHANPLLNRPVVGSSGILLSNTTRSTAHLRATTPCIHPAGTPNSGTRHAVRWPTHPRCEGGAYRVVT